MGPRHLKYFASFENDKNKMNVPVHPTRKQRVVECRCKKRVVDLTHMFQRRAGRETRKRVLCVHPDADMNMVLLLGVYAMHVTEQHLETSVWSSNHRSKGLIAHRLCY